MFDEKLTTSSLFLRGMLAAILIVLAAALRVVPHPWNFTPVGAMALFSGAVLRDRRAAFLLPLAAMFAGDVFIGLHKLLPVVYGSFLLSVLIGRWVVRPRSVWRIGGGVLLGAVQFFLITNFAVWRVFDTYPHSTAGLITCYVAGIPFFWNTLASDALYAAIFFGLFALAERLVPRLREASAPASLAH